MTIIAQKKKLRNQMLEKRRKIDLKTKKEYDERLCEILYRRISQRKARRIHCYLPMRSEINIRPLLEQLLFDGCELAAPKTLPERKLENRCLRSLDDLEKGPFNTYHPRGTALWEGTFDMIIVPGLAFDKSNNRLGYGGGYYDTFFMSDTTAYKLGICYPFQLVDQVPTEDHDVILEEVICLEQGMNIS